MTQEDLNSSMISWVVAGYASVQGASINEGRLGVPGNKRTWELYPGNKETCQKLKRNKGTWDPLQGSSKIHAL